ncbi:MAG: class I SAM-dependent methyltransferase [Solirubrobacterales bacterium]
MPGKPSDRQAWAVEVLDVRPSDRMLEVGCGHGVAVSGVCERLGEGGRMVAIDRSQEMIDAAAKRNAEHVAAGRLELVRSTFAEAELEPGSFDKLFAFHVAEFWRRPQQALGKARRVLRPGGAICLFNQAPGWRAPGQAEEFAAGLAETLGAHGFRAEAPVVAELDPHPALAVIARPG